MNFIKIILQVWLLLLITSVRSDCQSQQLNDASIDTLELTFESLSANEGLSAGLIWTIIQDRFGYLWIGTAKGFDKYDGYQFDNYKNDPEDSLSMELDIEGNSFPVFSDPENNIWLHSNKKGGYVFDMKREAFIPFDIPLWYNSFSDDHGNMWSMKVDDGWYLVDTAALPGYGDKFYKKDPKSCYQSVKHKFPDLNHKLAVPGINFRYNFAVFNGNIWLSSNDSIISYSLDYEQSSAKLRTKHLITLENKSGNPLDIKIIPSKDRQSLFLISDTGFCQIDTNTGTLFNCRTFPKRLKDARYKIVDSKNRLWFSTHGYLHTLNLSTGKLLVINNSDRRDKRVHSAFLIFEDNDHNLWMGTGGYGIFKYAIEKERFRYSGNRHFGPSMGPLYSTSSNNITSNYNNGMGYLNPISNTWTTIFKRDSIDPATQPASFHQIHYDALEESFFYRRHYGQDGQRKTKIFVINEEGEIVDQYLSHKLHRRLHVDSLSNWKLEFQTLGLKDSTYWKIALVYQNRLDGEQRFTYYSPKYLADYICSSVNESNVWLAFSFGGLLRFNIESEEWSVYKPGSEPFSISTDKVYSVLPDPDYPDSIIWIGTAAGLNQMDLKKEAFTKIGIKEGLPDEVIYGILSDERGQLWMSSNKGLFRMDPRTGELSIFSVKDGLQHNEFNKTSYHKDPEGKMYFGGVGGLSYFNPEDFYKRGEASKVVIHRMFLNDHEIHFKHQAAIELDGALPDKPLAYKPEIKIPYDQQMITFKFAVLDLTHPEGNRFRYKLDGYLDDWIDLGERNEVTFSNLDPGKYTLLVQGMNHNRIWNLEGDHIQFTITPMWWQTWWSKILMLLLPLILLFYFYSNKRKQRSAIEKMRNQISQDLHDEIGSTLSSISLFGTVAIKHLPQKEKKVTGLLKRINENAVEVTESMNDIVWTIKPDNDRIKHIVQRMRAYLAELTEATEWEITFDYNPEILSGNINMLLRRNIYLIFKESVNNAVKHSGGYKLNISLSLDDKIFTMIIQDNGKGFDLHKKKTNSLGGNGLNNIKKRAEDLGGLLSFSSSSKNGTAIKLSCKIQQ